MLWPAAGQDVFHVGREEAIPEPLSLVVRHLWSVSWRRAADRGFRSTVLTNPVPHLTFEDAEGGRLHGHDVPAALLHGLVSSVFTVDLPVAGRVTGVALQPGALTALLGTGMTPLTDTVVRACSVVGERVDRWAGEVLAEPDEAERRRLLLERLLEAFGPELDRVAGDTAYRVVRSAEELMRVREHVTIAPVADRVGVSPRTLQRLFVSHVGASPLWVLRRYRLQDAAAAIDAGEGEDLAGLAASLGFADQAHFTRAFTQVVGVPPSRYRAGERPHES